MFLVPKRIYFAMRNSIGDEDKLNQLDLLNMGTSYIEKAIQFRQQKSFKSQPEALEKTVSTLSDTSSPNTTSMNNNKQAAPATNISIPARINEEPAQDSITLVTPLPASPLDGHDFIFPTVSQPVQEIGNQQQQITDLRQEMEIGPENLLDYASQGQRFESGNVNQPRRKVAGSPKLECPFCKNVSYAKSYFLTKHLREKHNYRLSLDEERLANETLEQAKMETDLSARMKRREMPYVTFSGEEEQAMTNESTETDNLLPSFRGRKKTPMRLNQALRQSDGK